jgi:hypothetical protein
MYRCSWAVLPCSRITASGWKYRTETFLRSPGRTSPGNRSNPGAVSRSLDIRLATTELFITGGDLHVSGKLRHYTCRVLALSPGGL